MTTALALDVPLKVDIAAGPNWLDVRPVGDAAEPGVPIAGVRQPVEKIRDAAGRNGLQAGGEMTYKSSHRSSDIRSRRPPSPTSRFRSLTRTARASRGTSPARGIDGASTTPTAERPHRFATRSTPLGTLIPSFADR